ncbi:MAG: hypothetical protein LBI70_00015 [Rickettsiales bacterium]|jgi:hypothetical protein|nr:hypothetical protein [Rickettsiales bacterium]
MPEELGTLKMRIRNLFQTAVEVNNKDSNKRNEVYQKINDLTDIIVDGKGIEPDKVVQGGELVFETDLHGDMRALLNTLCRNGMVKYDPAYPNGIVFCDPVGGKEYTLKELETKRENSAAEVFRELMDRIQMLPAIEPTVEFKNYINCGDFVDRGKQSEQMIPLVIRLCKKFKEYFPGSKEGPTILMGNHENVYIDGKYAHIKYTFENNGNFLLRAADNESNSFGSSDNKKVKKFRTITLLTRKAIYEGTLKLASSIGKTLFSHTVITKDMVKSLAKNLSKLSTNTDLDEFLGTIGGKPVNIKETAETFEKLNKIIESNREFEEDDIKMLVSALNDFNVIRTTLESGLETEKDKTVLLSRPGAVELIEIMRGDRGITWLRRGITSEDDLIKGIKYVVGHDPVAIGQTNLDYRTNNRVFYADTGRSSGYNGGITKASYFHCDESVFKYDFSFLGKKIHQKKESEKDRILVLEDPFSKEKNIGRKKESRKDRILVLEDPSSKEKNIGRKKESKKDRILVLDGPSSRKKNAHQKEKSKKSRTTPILESRGKLVKFIETIVNFIQKIVEFISKIKFLEENTEEFDRVENDLKLEKNLEDINKDYSYFDDPNKNNNSTNFPSF